MDEARVERARHRADPGHAAAIDAPGQPARPGGVPRRVRAHRRRRRSSARSSTPTTATPTATWSTSPRAASACPTSRTTARRSSRRSARKYVDYLETLLTLAEPTDAAGDRRDGVRAGEADRRGPLGASRDPRRHQDLQPDPVRRAAGRAAVVRLRGLRPQPRRRRPDPRRDRRPAAVVPGAPGDGAGRDPDRGVAGVPDGPRGPVGGGVPAGRVRAGQLRLLRPHPVRHPGAAGPLEARRRPGRGRPGRGGRPRVRRPALPAAVQGADGRPGRQPARGLPAEHHRAGLDERGDQAARVREAGHLPAEDRLPGEVARLRRAGDRRRRPGRQHHPRSPRSRPTGSWRRSVRRSTATSGSCCRRP